MAVSSSVTSDSIVPCRMSVRTCIVPSCPSKRTVDLETNKYTEPGKIFFKFPRNKHLQQRWAVALYGPGAKVVGNIEKMFICEDHINLKAYMINYAEYKATGTVDCVYLRPDCVPYRMDYKTPVANCKSNVNINTFEQNRKDTNEIKPKTAEIEISATVTTHNDHNYTTATDNILNADTPFFKESNEVSIKEKKYTENKLNTDSDIEIIETVDNDPLDNKYAPVEDVNNEVESTKEINSFIAMLNTLDVSTFKTEIKIEDTDSETISMKSIEIFKCDSCTLEFLDETELKKHVQTKHLEIEPSKFKCDKCFVYFTTEDELIYHQSLVHDLALKFKCNKCLKFFEHESDVLKHCASIHKGDIKESQNKTEFNNVNNRLNIFDTINKSTEPESYDKIAKHANDISKQPLERCFVPKCLNSSDLCPESYDKIAKHANDISKQPLERCFVPKCLNSSDLCPESYDKIARNVNETSKQLKRCFVPKCFNNSNLYPEKHFFTVPSDRRLRKKWFETVNKKWYSTYVKRYKLYCCEDHFDFPKDILQRIGNKTIKYLLKPEVLPHIFNEDFYKRRHTTIHKLHNREKLIQNHHIETENSEQKRVGENIQKDPIRQRLKRCFVESCSNDSSSCPNKRFYLVPRSEEIRNAWHRAAQSFNSVHSTWRLYCCEDHFDLERDSIKVGDRYTLKNCVVPHIFHDEFHLLKHNILPEDTSRDIKEHDENKEIKNKIKDLKDNKNEVYENNNSESNGYDRNFIECTIQNIKEEDCVIHDVEKELPTISNSITKCIDCDVNFNNKNELDEHNKVIHKNYELEHFKDNTESLSNKTKTDIVNKEKDHKEIDYDLLVPLKVVTKKVIKRGFSENENLEETKTKILKKHKRHYCDICNKAFSYSSWHGHMSNVHSSIEYICKVCDLTFKCKRYLKRHMLYQHQVPRSSEREISAREYCEKCNKWYKNRDCLNHHIRNCHTEAVECEACGVQCRSVSYLRGHMRTMHGDADKRQCRHCHKLFGSVKQLIYHIKKKHPETLNKCPFCSKSFLKAIALNTHKKKCTQKNKNNIEMVKIENDSSDIDDNNDWCI